MHVRCQRGQTERVWTHVQRRDSEYVYRRMLSLEPRTRFMVVVEYMKFVGVREGDAEHRIR